MAFISYYSRLCLLIPLTYWVNFKSWNLFTLYKKDLYLRTEIVFTVNMIYYFIDYIHVVLTNLFDSEMQINSYINKKL